MNQEICDSCGLPAPHNLTDCLKELVHKKKIADEMFSAAIKVNPRIAAAWCNLGQAQYAIKRLADALQSFAKARALSPDDVEILYHTGSVYEHSETVIAAVNWISTPSY